MRACAHSTVSRALGPHAGHPGSGLLLCAPHLGFSKTLKVTGIIRKNCKEESGFFPNIRCPLAITRPRVVPPGAGSPEGHAPWRAGLLGEGRRCGGNRVAGGASWGSHPRSGRTGRCPWLWGAHRSDVRFSAVTERANHAKEALYEMSVDSYDG